MALDRSVKLVKSRLRYIKESDIQDHLQLVSRLLETKSLLSIAELRQRADETGAKDVVEFLDAL